MTKRLYLVVDFEDQIGGRHTGRAPLESNESDWGPVRDRIAEQVMKDSVVISRLTVVGVRQELAYEREAVVDPKVAACEKTLPGEFCPSCQGIHRADGTYIPGGGR